MTAIIEDHVQLIYPLPYLGRQAVAEKLPEGHNPTKGLRKYREQGRERFLTSDELGRLGAALAEGETIGLPYEIDDKKPN